MLGCCDKLPVGDKSRAVIDSRGINGVSTPWNGVKLIFNWSSRRSGSRAGGDRGEEEVSPLEGNYLWEREIK